MSEDTNEPVHPNWVTKKHYEKLTGFDDVKFRSKKQRKIWQDGVHFVVRDRGTWLNVKNIEAWLTNRNTPEESDLEPAEVLKSAGSTKVKNTPNTSQNPRHKLT